MALRDDVSRICDRLAEFGWRELLLRVTRGQLDIRSHASLTEQLAPWTERTRNVVREIKTVRDSGGAIVEYLITVRSYT